MSKTTAPDRIAKLKATKDKLNARIAKLEAAEKLMARKRDERRIRILGAVVLASLEKTPSIASILRPALRAYIDAHPTDRDVVADLLDPQPFTRTPEPRPAAPAAATSAATGEAGTSDVPFPS